MTITFKQLMENYQRACVGPFACDRIEAAEPIFTEILDKMLQPKVFDKGQVPEGYIGVPEESASDKVLAFTREEWEQRSMVLCGKHPMLFMGANLVKVDMPEDEVRFLNSKRPEMNQVVTT